MGLHVFSPPLHLQLVYRLDVRVKCRGGSHVVSPPMSVPILVNRAHVLIRIIDCYHPATKLLKHLYHTTLATALRLGSMWACKTADAVGQVTADNRSETITVCRCLWSLPNKLCSQKRRSFPATRAVMVAVPKVMLILWMIHLIQDLKVRTPVVVLSLWFQYGIACVYVCVCVCVCVFGMSLL